MSATNMAKTKDEVYLELWDRFREETWGPWSAETFGRWIHANQLMPDPTVDVVKLHARKAKQALRRKRIHDLKGRKIRAWLAVKIEKMTSNGQMVMEVIWDHIHEMSLDHALSTFEQRDEVITKQRRSATRDLQSCLDFNPNVQGHDKQFVFGFLDEEPGEAVTESISESPGPSSYPPTPKG